MPAMKSTRDWAHGVFSINLAVGWLAPMRFSAAGLERQS